MGALWSSHFIYFSASRKERYSLELNFKKTYLCLHSWTVVYTFLQGICAPNASFIAHDATDMPRVVEEPAHLKKLPFKTITTVCPQHLFICSSWIFRNKVSLNPSETPPENGPTSEALMNSSTKSSSSDSSCRSAGCRLKDHVCFCL